ncbi:MAG TPA: MmcQ/YjbR family DNA-binding protein [Thermoanaerobaculia bacterium]
MSGHDPNRERTAAELAAVKRLNAIARTLPEVTETRDGFGHTVFKVGKKSLVFVGDDDGRVWLSLNVDRETQRFLIAHGGFERTPYIGQHGWTSHEATRATDWEHIAELMRESYRRVAPKRLLKLLETA